MKLIDALELLKNNARKGRPVFRVFLACSCTPLHLQTFIAAHLTSRLPQHRIEIETGIYGDLVGNLERPKSDKFDSVAIVIEWVDLDPRLGIRSLGGWRPNNLPDIVDSATGIANRLEKVLIEISQAVPVACCLPTLPLPPLFPPRTQQSSLFELQLHRTVGSLAAAIANAPRIRVVDRQTLDEVSPPSDRFDVKSEIIAGFPYKLNHASAVGDFLASLIHNPQPKKGLITDLDETLWAGFLGEVGVEGVSWSLDHHSQMHGVYQQFLASLAGAGVLIGVASKNDALLVEQALQRKDFLIDAAEMFPLEIHWSRKTESVRRILRSWNIGAESVVFIDDSPMEVAEVQATFPEMHCMAFPTNDYQAIWSLLRNLRDLFGRDIISKEDELRLSSIRQTAILQESLGEQGTTVGEFLAKSNASIQFHFGRQPADRRAFELVNKTNQFNLNGKRFTESEWVNYLRDPASFLLSATYQDKYGPLGKIAVLLGRSNRKIVWVDSWVMSCRAFSRRIEHQCLKFLFDKLGTEAIAFDYQSISRNGPLLEFFTQMNGVHLSNSMILSRAAFLKSAPILSHQISETADE